MLPNTLLASYPFLAQIQEKAERRKAKLQQAAQQVLSPAPLRGVGKDGRIRTDEQGRQEENARALSKLPIGGISAPSSWGSGSSGANTGGPFFPWSGGSGVLLGGSGGFSPNQDGSIGGFVRQDPWAQPYTIEQTALGKYYADKERREQAAHNEAMDRKPFATLPEYEEEKRKANSRMFWEEQDKRKARDMQDPAYRQYAEAQKAKEEGNASFNAEQDRKKRQQADTLDRLDYWNNNPQVDPWGG
jgi:hypothetical protein